MTSTFPMTSRWRCSFLLGGEGVHMQNAIRPFLFLGWLVASWLVVSCYMKYIWNLYIWNKDFVSPGWGLYWSSLPKVCHTQEPLKSLARFSASVYTQDRHAGIASSLLIWIAAPQNSGPFNFAIPKNTMKLDIHPVFTEQLPDSSHDFSSSVKIFSRNVPSCFQETTTAMNQKKSTCSLKSYKKNDEFSNFSRVSQRLTACCWPWILSMVNNKTLNNQTSRILSNSNFRMKSMSKKNRNQKKLHRNYMTWTQS